MAKIEIIPSEMAAVISCPDKVYPQKVPLNDSKDSLNRNQYSAVFDQKLQYLILQ